MIGGVVVRANSAKNLHVRMIETGIIKSSLNRIATTATASYLKQVRPLGGWTRPSIRVLRSRLAGDRRYAEICWKDGQGGRKHFNASRAVSMISTGTFQSNRDEILLNRLGSSTKKNGVNRSSSRRSHACWRFRHDPAASPIVMAIGREMFIIVSGRYMRTAEGRVYISCH